MQDVTEDGGNALSDQEGSEAATVGKRLRAAREAANLGVDDVAHALKFSPRQIDLLEADNYAALPGMTIVRGFVRSYAKLMKLEADPLLKLLDGRTPHQAADVRPPDNMGIADDARSPRQFSWLASAAIVFAMAALLLGLWHFVGPVARSVGVGGEERPSVTVSPAPLAPPVTAPAEQSASPAAPVPVLPPASEPVMPAVKFSFEGRAWLEVIDANKQVLHSGENQAGTQLTLNGVPPFEIVVGNAAKVKLIFGEREIDLAPHTRAEVARLKVE